jgi:DNA-binding GntR family transcriptional regulator
MAHPGLRQPAPDLNREWSLGSGLGLSASRHPHPGWNELALQQHRAIIDLLIAGNGPEAADALEYHILDMKTRVIADFASGPHDDTDAE